MSIRDEGQQGSYTTGDNRYGMQPSGAQHNFMEPYSHNMHGNAEPRFGGQFQAPLYGTPYAAPPQKPRTGLWIAIIILAAVAIAAIGLAIFAVTAGDDESLDDSSGASSSDYYRARADGAPSKADVRDGLESFMDNGFQQRGTSREELSSAIPGGMNFDLFYGCIVDEIYDGLSAEFLTALAENDPGAPAGDEDAAVLMAAQDFCFGRLLDQ